MRQGQGWAFVSALLIGVIGTALLPAGAVCGEWALPDTRLGIRTAPLLLLSRPDVQADLRLDAAQITAAQDAINELTRRAAALKGKTGAAVVAERRAIDEAQVDWLGKNLTGNQLIRLRQIELQWEGPSALLSRPTVAEHLKLTPEQRHLLAQMISERNALLARGKPAKDRTAFIQMATEVLSSEQRELWDSLLGSPFRFAMTGPPPRTHDDSARQAGHSQPKR
jgi:hypothetical protein